MVHVESGRSVAVGEQRWPLQSVFGYRKKIHDVRVGLTPRRLRTIADFLDDLARYDSGPIGRRAAVHRVAGVP